jgi:hypothetical protein
MSGTNILQSGAQLVAGQYLVSTNGRFKAVMQGDGNFVVYDGGRALWASMQNWGAPGSATISMQGDGNLCMYPTTETRYGGSNWCSYQRLNIPLYGNHKLIMQDDGNLVMYKSDGVTALWNSNTAQAAAPVPAGPITNTPAPLPSPAPQAPTTTPETTPATTPAPAPAPAEEDTGMSGGAIAAIVIGIIMCLLLAGVGVYMAKKK